MEKVSAGLPQATSELLKNISKQSRKMSEVVDQMNTSFAEAAQELDAANKVGPVTPEDSDPNYEGLSLEAELASLNEQATQSTPEESVIQMLEAKTAYNASVKALESVNDLEKESVDILK